MDVFDGNWIIDTLKLGLIGLVFLIIYYTFQLLKTEQKKDRPNANILKSIKNFNITTISFAVIVGTFTILEFIYKPKPTVCDRCIEDLELTIELSNSPAQTAKSLQELINRNVGNCLQEMKKDRLD